MSKNSFPPLRYRQIHLDFHTSEAIRNIGRDFDADDFVNTLKAANVDSITLFARCHHGWCYYPSEVGDAHPHLDRPDLLGEMVDACRKADITTPIYLTVQWDENLARTRPEWLVMSANNKTHDGAPTDGSANFQLTAAWHTLCLSNEEYRRYLIDMGMEIIQRYDPPGLFYDIVSSHDCVCPKCVSRMQAKGLDPERAEDRHTNDEAINEMFRQEVSTAIWANHPEMRIFFNCGHIDKRGAKRFETYSHLEIESLPTGPWGYDHFPLNARYAAALGMDFLGQTGKFHTSWGEFGGYKQSDALIYECAQTAALGAKCLIGDQLHPLGGMDADTYKFIAPAYAHIEKLEPYLQDAKQISEIAILSSEYFVSGNARSHASDDGAVRMLLELKIPFDVIDPEMDFGRYRVIVLPDNVPTDDNLATKLNTYVTDGGKVLFSGRSGRNPDNGQINLDAGLSTDGGQIDFTPSYAKTENGIFPAGTPQSPIVMYGTAETVTAVSAETLATCHASYFNRTYRHFCSHKHSPVDLDSPALSPAVTRKDGFAYVAYPIFKMYQQSGQPIYKYLVQGLLNDYLPEPILRTNLPSGGRANITRQSDKHRIIAHLLYGAPQQRGKQSPEAVQPHPMEMIEDIPALASITASVRCDQEPARAFNVITGEDVPCYYEDGYANITVGDLHIHAAIALDFDNNSQSEQGSI
ncbi:MAG: beta-galactosidase trimerization domain-containing protein [Roseibium sp.]